MKKEQWSRQIAKQSRLLHNAQCAVLVPVVEMNGERSLLFEVRSGILGWQPGDICFPGGGLQQSDESEEVGAVRETMEELGISQNHIHVLGPLDYLESPVGVTVWPFAAELDTVDFFANSAEVESLFTVPIQWFLSQEPEITAMETATRPAEGFPADIIGQPDAQWKKRTSYDIYIYRYQGKIIWGITAHIVKNFIHAYRRIEMKQE